MFAQVITFKVTDAEALHTAFGTWQLEVAPGATGLLGSTSGVTDDGTAVIIIRYRTAEQCHANATRTEHLRWSAGVAAMVVGELETKDSIDVVADLVGDPDEAEFVQIMRGTLSDPELARKLSVENSAVWASFRPDILGTVLIFHENSEYTMVIYFTNEVEAREAEQKELPEELRPQMELMAAAYAGEPSFLDVRDPWLS